MGQVDGKDISMNSQRKKLNAAKPVWIRACQRRTIRRRIAEFGRRIHVVLKARSSSRRWRLL